MKVLYDMKQFRKENFNKNVLAGHNNHVASASKQMKRLSPEGLPRAGMRLWLEERVAHGPLNGAMRNSTLTDRDMGIS